MYEIENEKHFQKIARNMFLRNLSKIKDSYKPKNMFILFDGEGKNFRHTILPTYKSNRKEKPEDLFQVKSEIYHFLDLHNFSFQISKNIEADDLIASYVNQNKGEDIFIFTGDNDLAALVNKNVTLLLDKNKKVKSITIQNFHHFFDVPPSKFSDFKALQGDKSDFIKGIDGLFKSEALHVLLDFHSIEEFLKKGKDHHLYPKISKEKDKILINKTVASLKDDCEVLIDRNKTQLSNIYIPDKISKKIGW